MVSIQPQQYIDPTSFQPQHCIDCREQRQTRNHLNLCIQHTVENAKIYWYRHRDNNKVCYYGNMIMMLSDLNMHVSPDLINRCSNLVLRVQKQCSEHILDEHSGYKYCKYCWCYCG